MFSVDLGAQHTKTLFFFLSSSSVQNNNSHTHATCDSKYIRTELDSIIFSLVHFNKTAEGFSVLPKDIAADTGCETRPSS